MKKLVAYILFILPVVAMSQGFNLPSVTLKSMSNQTITASKLVNNGQFVLIYFFNDNTPGASDQLQYLASLKENNDLQKNTRIIAICSSSRESVGHLKSFLDGNNIDLEAYLDVNGDLQRAMGLPDNSSVVLSGFGQDLAAKYFDHNEFNGELTGLLFDQTISDNMLPLKTSKIAP